MDNTFDEKLKQLDKLAQEVLALSCNTILVNFRFLDLVLNNFEFVSNTLTTIGTNGKHLFYSPKSILLAYKNEKEYVVHAYLHLLMHCIFRHQFVGTQIDEEKWNLACDIAVEKYVIELNLQSAKIKEQYNIETEIENIENQLNSITAEKVYKYLLDFNISKYEFERLKDTFAIDDHSFWYMSDMGVSIANRHLSINGEQNDTEELSNMSSDFFKQQNEFWKDVSERVLIDLQMLSTNIGDTAGSMIQNLKEVNRQRYDYSSFLKKFATRNEVMKINDDEFDYIFYTYGLKLYEKMPLIEPLEYMDERVVKEFVVAIDTSGSVSGELVQAFIQKTYNILKSTESFAKRVNIHIIQCDTAIQQDVKITNERELDVYIKNMKLFGFGGTDFRPVFEYVNDLIANKEFSNLKGLIYFTDGYGIFPSKKPDYDTAFVFVDNDYTDVDIPPWAIKLVLKTDEI